MNFENLEKILSSKYFQYTYFGNSIARMIIAIFLFFILLIILRVFKVVILSKLKNFSEKTNTNIDNIAVGFIEAKLFPLLYYGAFYISMIQLNLSDGVSKIITSFGIIFLTIQITRTIINIIINILKKNWGEMLKNSAGDGIITIVKVIIWGICTIFILDNLGFNISTAVAGMGIGGVAIALASQNILNDLFNYFVIFFDKPFEPGDFIVIEDFSGTIESIGIKTTRIRSISGEELIFSNSDLSTSRIRNYKRMKKRRVVFKIGIVYETELKKLKQIPMIIKEIIDITPDTEFSRCHFKSYNDYSLDFEVVYYVMNNDYNYYMDIQQEINLKIFEKFQIEGIDMAFPTQTLFIRNIDQNESAKQAPIAPSEEL